MYYYITNPTQIPQFQKSLISNPEDSLGFDTETTGLDPFTCTLLLVQFDLAGDQFIFDARKLGEQTTKYIIELVRERELIGFNLKFDIKIIKQKFGIMLENLWDIQLAEVMSENGLAEDRYPTLEFVTLKYLGIELDKTVRRTFYDPAWDGVITQEQIQYSAEDVQHLPKLKEILSKKLQDQKQLKVLKEVENPLIPSVASMELNGIYLDQESWLSLEARAIQKAGEVESSIKEYIWNEIVRRIKLYPTLESICTRLYIPVKTKKLQKLVSETATEFGKVWFVENLNISSSKQMKEILHFLGIDVKDTNEDTLIQFGKHEFIDLLLEFRDSRKKYTTYGSKFLSNIHPVTNCIHSNFNSLGAETARFSSSNVNLQQIPRNKEYRVCFRSHPGCKLISVDYSQNEYRLVGAITNEPIIISAYKAGKDMHTATAALEMEAELGRKVDFSEVTKEKRNAAKMHNFLTLYGGSAWGLAAKSGMTKEEAEFVVNAINAGYPTMVEFRRLFGEKCFQLKKSKTLLGRIRNFKVKLIYSDHKEMDKERARIMREAYNMIIQGTAAEICKQALIRLYYENPFGDDFKILLTVHDEIVCEAKEEIAEEAFKFQCRIMEEVEQQYLGEIPAVVEGKISDVWEH